MGVLYFPTIRLWQMPAEYPYRKQTEALINSRANIIKTTPTIDEVSHTKLKITQILLTFTLFSDVTVTYWINQQ